MARTRLWTHGWPIRTTLSSSNSSLRGKPCLHAHASLQDDDNSKGIQANPLHHLSLGPTSSGPNLWKWPWSHDSRCQNAWRLSRCHRCQLWLPSKYRTSRSLWIFPFGRTRSCPTHSLCTFAKRESAHLLQNKKSKVIIKDNWISEENLSCGMQITDSARPHKVTKQGKSGWMRLGNNQAHQRNTNYSSRGKRRYIPHARCQSLSCRDTRRWSHERIGTPLKSCPLQRTNSRSR